MGTKTKDSKNEKGNGRLQEEILITSPKKFSSILTSEALTFITRLQKKFGPLRESLLDRRKAVLREIQKGHMPDFLLETASLRQDTWKVGSIPLDLLDRRVEITGPVDRKMIINALNSGANFFMADFEDSHCPTWENTIEGQVNLYEAVRKKISYESQEGKKYTLNKRIATLGVRPRGWHMVEKHVLVDGKPVSASLFDFGLFFFHNARELVSRGTGPYFYLPKMENHLEARLWNDVFVAAQKDLGLPIGTIKATVLIETILAAFEMDEILYELRDHSAGLNCGRWDYIFNFIKKFCHRPDFVLPDRSQVTMNVHFLRSYSQLLIKTCHRRSIHAMGGMAVYIPVKNNSEANKIALEKVLADKEREATLGHDGTWVAHPGLVEIARGAFDRVIKNLNQIDRQLDVTITAQDLTTIPEGSITEEGLRTNINVSLQYLEAWLQGLGCVPLYNLMEDAATVEISRAQIWQWIRHPQGTFTDGRKITFKMFSNFLDEEMSKIARSTGPRRFDNGRFQDARKILVDVIQNDDFVDFITLPAYEYLD